MPDSSQQPADDRVFGPPARWPADDFVGVSEGPLSAALALAGYAEGLFPMPHGPSRRRPLIGWWSPDPRGVLPLDGLRVSRSLRKTARRYEIRIDTDFAGVLAGCADPSRPHGWIDAGIEATYTALHAAGVVHSVEAWTRPAPGAAAELAGGLYGVSLGGLFAGESMFHRPDIGRDASKAALIGLVELLLVDAAELPGLRLLDVQWQTEHLASLGVVEIARADYLDRLADALTLPPPVWRAP